MPIFARSNRLCADERTAAGPLELSASSGRGPGAGSRPSLQKLAQGGDIAVEGADTAVERAQSAVAAQAAAVDRLDCADRIALTADDDLRRILAEIDAADRSLSLRRDGDGLTVGAGRRDRERVLAGRPGDAIVALAVPAIGLASAVQRYGSGKGRLTGRTGYRHVACRGRGRIQRPRGRRTRSRASLPSR